MEINFSRVLRSKFSTGLTVYQFLIKYILLVADWRKEEGAYPWKTEF
jgi:hypothetical protein